MSAASPAESRRIGQSDSPNWSMRIFHCLSSFLFFFLPIFFWRSAVWARDDVPVGPLSTNHSALWRMRDGQPRTVKISRCRWQEQPAAKAGQRQVRQHLPHGTGVGRWWDAVVERAERAGRSDDLAGYGGVCFTSGILHSSNVTAFCTATLHRRRTGVGPSSSQCIFWLRK